jgi:hypothetical protein
MASRPPKDRDGSQTRKPSHIVARRRLVGEQHPDPVGDQSEHDPGAGAGDADRADQRRRPRRGHAVVLGHRGEEDDRHEQREPLQEAGHVQDPEDPVPTRRRTGQALPDEASRREGGVTIAHADSTTSAATAKTRSVCRQPRPSTRAAVAIGLSTVPTPMPVTAMPIARARWCSNHRPTLATVGTYTQADPDPDRDVTDDRVDRVVGDGREHETTRHENRTDGEQGSGPYRSEIPPVTLPSERNAKDATEKTHRRCWRPCPATSACPRPGCRSCRPRRRRTPA